MQTFAKLRSTDSICTKVVPCSECLGTAAAAEATRLASTYRHSTCKTSYASRVQSIAPARHSTAAAATAVQEP